MKWIKSIIAFITATLAGMYGGQKNKAARRFVMPAIIQGYCFSMGWQWRYLAFLGMIPVLIMGYGPNSVLSGWLGGIEWLIRAVYALILSIPFIVFGLPRWITACVLLIVAFAIRAGSLGNIPHFGDFLIEDLIRYGTLMALVLFNVMKKT